MIILELPFPPSNNQYYRTVNNRIVISKKGRAYKKRIIALIEQYGLNQYPIDYPIIVRVEFMPPDNRVRDSDNFLKGLFDGLTNARFWLDDSLVAEHSVRFYPKDKNPRAILYVEPDMENSFTHHPLPQ